jgi:hypothetical protein
MIINLINGYLRTPKIDQFNKLVTWINNNSNNNFTINETDTSSILKNAWLSGFIDAPGSFSINIRKKTEKERIELRLEYVLNNDKKTLKQVNLTNQSLNLSLKLLEFN